MISLFPEPLIGFDEFNCKLYGETVFIFNDDKNYLKSNIKRRGRPRKLNESMSRHINDYLKSIKSNDNKFTTNDSIAYELEKYILNKYEIKISKSTAKKIMRDSGYFNY